MKVFVGFEDIKSAVGSEIGASEWIEITQQRINQFAEATCDEQWIHVDQERRERAAGRQDDCARASLAEPRADVHPLGHGPQGAQEYTELWYGSNPFSFARSGDIVNKRSNYDRQGGGCAAQRAARELPHGDRNRRQSTTRLRRRPYRPALSLTRGPLVGADMHIINP
jgi:hypothetical protein